MYINFTHRFPYSFWEDAYKNSTVIVSDPTMGRWVSNGIMLYETMIDDTCYCWHSTTAHVVTSSPVGVDFYVIGDRGEEHGKIISISTNKRIPTFLISLVIYISTVSLKGPMGEICALFTHKGTNLTFSSHNTHLYFPLLSFAAFFQVYCIQCKIHPEKVCSGVTMAWRSLKWSPYARKVWLRSS